MAANTPQNRKNFLGLTYSIQSDTDWLDDFRILLEKKHIDKLALPSEIEKDFKANINLPQNGEEALRFMTRIPLMNRWKKDPIYQKLFGLLSAEQMKKVPAPSSIWGPQGVHAKVEAGLLDFPRKTLPPEVWLYEDDRPLPRLQPKLRAEILKEARYRLKKFGAQLVGVMLYGGAATYQYHRGADIDCSCYIDWETFDGDEEILQEAFKNVEIPWDGYVIHLFVKPSTQQEQVEVADACYDVLKDRWKLPPLILPKDFDPEVYFKPMIEMAEKKAEEIDLLMGKVSRQWAILKKALEAQKEGPRDPETVDERIEIQKLSVKQSIDKLVEEFTEVWVGRRRMHDELRKKFVLNQDVGRYERFQPAEVTWKYLDGAGYCEFLKLLSKAHEAGSIDNLIEAL